MKTRTLAIVLAFLLVAVLAGCEASREDTAGTPPDDGAANGSRLAPGLYDMPDGTVQAVGTLVWRDLEGGFWAIVAPSADEAAEGATIAVIANGTEMTDVLPALEGRSVVAYGRRFEGASIRMAGPEMTVERIEETDAGRPAE